MEDALLFQAQAEETCALWQAGAPVPWGGGGGWPVPEPPRRVLRVSASCCL